MSGEDGKTFYEGNNSQSLEGSMPIQSRGLENEDLSRNVVIVVLPSHMKYI